MMTTATGSSRPIGDNANNASGDGDEMTTWNRIVQLRVKQSEKLGLTLRLLNDHGNEDVTGNIDSAMEDNDDMEAYTIVRQFLLQQLLLYHVGIMISNNQIAGNDPNILSGKTQERVLSWKVLRDIFYDIDEAKTKDERVEDAMNDVEADDRVQQNGLFKTSLLNERNAETNTASILDHNSMLNNQEIDNETDCTTNSTRRLPLIEMIGVNKNHKSRDTSTTTNLHSESVAIEPLTNGSHKATKTSKVSQGEKKNNDTTNKANKIKLPTAQAKEITTQKNAVQSPKIPKKRKRPQGEPTVIDLPRQHNQTTASLHTYTVPDTNNGESSTTSIDDRSVHNKSDHPLNGSKNLCSKLLTKKTKPKSLASNTNNGKKSIAPRDKDTVITNEDRPIQKRVRPGTNDAQQHGLTSLIPVENLIVSSLLKQKEKKNIRQQQSSNLGNSLKVPKKKKVVELATNGVLNIPVEKCQNEHRKLTIARNEGSTSFKQIRQSNETASENTTLRSIFEKSRDTSLTRGLDGNSTRKQLSSNSSSPPKARATANGNTHHDTNEHSKKKVGNEVGAPERSNRTSLFPTNQPKHISHAPTAVVTLASIQHSSRNENVLLNSPTVPASIPISSHIENVSLNNPSSIEDVFKHEAVRKSRDVLTEFWLQEIRVLACGVCGTADIQINSLVRHCETVRHKTLLQESSKQDRNGNKSTPNQLEIFTNEAVNVSREMEKLTYEKIDGHNIWKCSLCNVNGLRTVDLVGHCESSEHKHLMKKCIGRPLNGHVATPDDETEGKALNDDVVTASTEFLLREQYSEYSPVTWRCTLCDIGSIPTCKLTSHCAGGQHKLFLKMKKKVAVRLEKLAESKACRRKDRSLQSVVIEPNATKLFGAAENSDPAQISNPITFLVKVDSVNNGHTHAPLDSCTVTFVQSEIQSQDVTSIGNRLQEWDPFWTIKTIICAGQTHTIQSTTSRSDMIKTAMQHYFPGNLRSKYDLSIVNNNSWNDGDCALQLRMLPVSWVSTNPKRADCHIWPKGTFIQINGASCKIDQRKQQAPPFDKEWKLLCKELSCNDILGGNAEPNCLQICCVDDEHYYYGLSYCCYVGPEQLFSRLIDRNSAERMEYLSFESCLEKAREFANQQMTVSIDSDNDSDADETGKFIFSLTCPISRTLIVTPVRGKQCKHFQCFDLRNYINTNARVTGTRWRCASCEKFVSLQSLQICGLTSHLLTEFKSSATSERERVEFCADGQYKLLEQQVSRHRKQLALASTNDSGAGKLSAERSVEVIDCD